ncbi:protein outspread-like [Photinus pyralis]|uniref:protein outspread-like n=1 Tax=Photinus pyralis TaxID=7054 RepID=UPI0012675157|nr:protein outspread-like [Photinus pyralis]
MSQCRKFAPNIFNKSKCSNCFRQKEEHSAEALECNRASRAIARSGYLFVAPDWDFSVPLNRTKVRSMEKLRCDPSFGQTGL